ncbi:MAG: SAM-dependent methyltransferase, partial [Chloroflexi bacterium]|nr:SAM-dependent methyltransferase [Chloroflexota bacterium]
SLAAQKLASGGLLILETINPTCLTALLQAYLLDPSHRTPLHPQTLRFLAEQAGFFIQEVRFLRPVPQEAQLMPWPTEAGAWAEIANANIARLNDLLFGAQDYALIATWPGK